MTNPNFVFTPIKHICLGEVVEIDGVLGILVKKPGRDIYDFISIEAINHFCSNHNPNANIN